MSQAWEEIYASHYRRLVTLMTALCGSVTDAEEAVQEAFARGLGMTGRRPPPDDPQAWLYRVASNVVKMRWRRTKVAQRIWPWLATREQVVSPADGSDDRLSLVTAMRRLPLEQREALALHYFADMSVAAIADRIEVPVGTVKARLSRGRDSLAGLLATDVWPPADLESPADRPNGTVNVDDEVGMDGVMAGVRQPSFSVIERRRARRSRHGAIGAAVLTAIVVAGAAWGGSRLPQPPPITPTPSPSQSPSPDASLSPTPSTSPSVGPLPQAGDGLGNESAAASPSGAVFVLRRECVANCSFGNPQTTLRLALFRSSGELGRTWTQVGTVPAQIGFEGRIAVSDDKVMWIVAVETLWGTRDGGKTWQHWAIPEAGAFDVRDGRIWIGTAGEGMWVAAAGSAPVRVTRGLPQTPFWIGQIVARTRDSAMIAILLDGQPEQWYRSDDKGSSWQLMTHPCAGVQMPGTGGQPDEFRTAMAASPAGNVVWTICTEEPTSGQRKVVVISLDGGGTWQSQGALEFPGHGYVIYPINARIAWRIGFNVDDIIMRTEDAHTWMTVTPPSEANILRLVVVDGDTAIVINAGTVFITKDGGRTWITTTLPLMPSPA